MTETFNLRSLTLVLPEIILFFTAIFVLLADIRANKQRSHLINIIVFLGFSVALVHAVLILRYGNSTVLSRSLVIDSVSQYFKVFLILTGLLVSLLVWLSKEIKSSDQAEVLALVTLSTLGFCISSSAVHLILLFLAFEMGSFAFYVLTAFKRRSSLSTESGIKALVQGSLSSIFFALGIAMLYGIGQSFNIFEIHAKLITISDVHSYLWIAFGFIFIAIAARAMIFPFHFASIDIIEGAPTPVSAFMAVTPIIASMAFALRICIHLFSVKNEAVWVHLPGIQWTHFIAGVAAVTMTIGNLTALYQKSLKRVLAYSAAAQIGFILMGLVVSNHVGLASVLFALAAYGIAILGSFFIIQWLSDHYQSKDLFILRGLVWKHPYEGVMLCLFLLSLAGIPPLVGFVSKFYILGVILREKIYWLSIVGIVNWVIGLAYLLPIIRQIFATPHTNQGEKSLENLESLTSTAPVHAALLVLLVPTIALGIYWDPFMKYITRSLSNVMW